MSDEEIEEASVMLPWERVVLIVIAAALIAGGILTARFPSHACACVFAEGYSTHVHIEPDG